jgi:hypothetical protein
MQAVRVKPQNAGLFVEVAVYRLKSRGTGGHPQERGLPGDRNGEREAGNNGRPDRSADLRSGQPDLLSPGFSSGYVGGWARLNVKVLLNWDDKGC